MENAIKYGVSIDRLLIGEDGEIQQGRQVFMQLFTSLNCRAVASWLNESSGGATAVVDHQPADVYSPNDVLDLFCDWVKENCNYVSEDVVERMKADFLEFVEGGNSAEKDNN